MMHLVSKKLDDDYHMVMTVANSIGRDIVIVSSWVEICWTKLILLRIFASWPVIVTITNLSKFGTVFISFVFHNNHKLDNAQPIVNPSQFGPRWLRFYRHFYGMENLYFCNIQVGKYSIESCQWQVSIDLEQAWSYHTIWHDISLW